MNSENDENKLDQLKQHIGSNASNEQMKELLQCLQNNDVSKILLMFEKDQSELKLDKKQRSNSLPKVQQSKPLDFLFQNDNSTLVQIEKVQVEQQRFETNFLIINDNDHDEDGFQEAKRQKLLQVSQTITKSFAIKKWQKLRIKDLQIHLQNLFQKVSRANFEVMIRDEVDHQKLRYPNAEFEDKKMVFQMQSNIVLKSSIKIIIAIEVDPLLWSKNDEDNLLKEKQLLIQVQCDPLQTTLLEILNDLKREPKLTKYQSCDGNQQPYCPLDLILKNENSCAIICDLTGNKLHNETNQHMINKSQFEMTLSQLSLKNMYQVQLINLQMQDQVVSGQQVEDEEIEVEGDFMDDQIKEQIVNQGFNKQRLPLDVMNFLKKALKQIEHLYDEKAVILFGNTGCGKSTMILSLVYGPKALQETRLQNRKIIQLKPQISDLIKNQSNIQIGDDLSRSKTFIPKIEFLEYMVFIDIAGLHDSDGKLIEYVNRFILRTLFEKLREVKFILPITEAEFTENRANGVRDQLRELSNILGKKQDKMLPNVIPVLTKANPKKSYDLEHLQSQLYDALMMIDKRMQTNDKRQLTSEEQMQQEETQNAMCDFSRQLIIYDPLERDIKEDLQDPNSNNWSTSRQEFLDIIHNTNALDTKQFDLPMSDNMLQDFNQALEGMRQQCIKLAKLEYKNIWNLPYDPLRLYEFKNNRKVQELCEVLKFLDHHNLLENAQELKKQFEKFINTTNRNIQDALTHQQCNDKQKEMYDLKTQISNITEEILSFDQAESAKSTLAKCEELVKLMVSLYDQILSMQNETNKDNVNMATNELTVINCQAAIIDTINALIYSDRLDPFFYFGYQLRKFENDDDKYSKAFLETESTSMNEKALKQIILSNFYNQKHPKYQMQVRNKCRFKLMLDQKWRMVSSGLNETLFIKKDKKDYEDGFQFLLTDHGIEIGLFQKDYRTKNLEWLRLTTSHGKVLAQTEQSLKRFYDQSLSDYQEVKLTTSNKKTYKDPFSFNWKLDHNSSYNKFNIYLNYKDYTFKPRLVASQDPSNTIFYSNCQATSQVERGYDKPNQDSWLISYFEKSDDIQNMNYIPLISRKKIEFSKLEPEEQNEILVQIGGYLRNCQLHQVKAELNYSESLEIIDGKSHSRDARILVESNVALNDETTDQINQFKLLTQQLRSEYDGIDVHISQHISQGSLFRTINNLKLISHPHYKGHFLMQPTSVNDILDFKFSDPLASISEQYDLKSVEAKQGQVLIILYWDPLNSQSIKMIKFFNRTMLQQKQRWAHKVRIIAISLEKSKHDIRQLIEINKLFKIEFWHCNYSLFLSDYAISYEPSIMIVDTNGKLVYKTDEFDGFEPWAKNVARLIAGEEVIFNSTQLKEADLQQDINKQNQLSQTKDSKEYNINEFYVAINMFEEKIKEKQQLQILLKDKESKIKLKSASCKFIFSQIVDCYQPQGQDICKEFVMKIMLTGEKDISKKVIKQLEYILSKDNQLFDLFQKSVFIQFTDENIQFKVRGEMPSFHWNTSTYFDDIVVDTSRSAELLDQLQNSATSLATKVSETYSYINHNMLSIPNDQIEEEKHF